MDDLRIELNAAKIWKSDYQMASATIVEYEKIIKQLRQELAVVKSEKDEMLKKASNERNSFEKVC